MQRRICKHCGTEVIETSPLRGRLPYYCQGCGKDKEEDETEEKKED